MPQMRLQKLLARAGVASRRHAEGVILAGRVTVNGQVVDELGAKADPEADEVAVDGLAIQLPAEAVVLMLHKPAGCVTTMDDPQGRPTVAGLVPIDRFPGLFPVGRLDADTTGLLLMTNDGELGHGLLHPRRAVGKEYLALVEGRPAEGDLQRLREGVCLDDGLTAPAQVELLEGAAAQQARERIGCGPGASGQRRKHPKGRSLAAQLREAPVVRLVIHEGRNRQVRRMLEAVGHPVLALHRDSFGSLGLGSLPRGEWRQLQSAEMERLREVAAGEGRPSSR